MTNTVIECSQNTNEDTLSRIKRQKHNAKQAIQRTSEFFKDKYQQSTADDVRIESKESNHEPKKHESVCDHNKHESRVSFKPGSDNNTASDSEEEISCSKPTSQIKNPSWASQISNDSYDVTYKVTVIGDTRVGKSSIIARLNGLTFSTNRASTVGIDYVSKTFRNDGVATKLQVWDTPGQERFRTMTKYHADGAKGIVLVYDVTDKDSLEWVTFWLDHMSEEMHDDNTEPITIFIIGNKNDLEDERAITKSEGKKVCDKYFCHSFHELSAATDPQHIYRIFHNLSNTLTEIYHPDLLDSHMSPCERKEKYDKLAENRVCNGKCACGGLPSNGLRFKIKPPKKVKRKSNMWSLLSCTSGIRDD